MRRWKALFDLLSPRFDKDFSKIHIFSRFYLFNPTFFSNFANYKHNKNEIWLIKIII